MNKFDVIIVGQGLAGSVLARRLLASNKSIFVFDRRAESTASKIAAGLVNPITGRRFVLSWLFELLNPAARKFYIDWQTEIGEQILFELPIMRAMEDRRFEDDVEAKTADPYYKKYIQRWEDSKNSYFIPGERTYKISGSYRIDVQKLLDVSRQVLVKKQSISFEAFDYGALQIRDTSVSYKNIEARHIIFCEGAEGQRNPWFSYLPFQTTKGEIFELIQENALDYAYKRDLILLPLETDKLWCGSLNFWNYDDELPSDDGELILLQKLKKVYHPTPHIHKHLAAIRPTVKDRRPLIGRHPDLSSLLIFNGLGTKGTLLAPYFSEQLVDHLYAEADLMKEASIARFKKE